MPNARKKAVEVKPQITPKLDLLERFVPILLIISVGLAFIVGMLWQKVTFLEGGTQVAGTQAQQVAPPPAAPVDKAAIDALFDKNLITFGDKDRKVRFVEVADPSCPWCHVAGGHNSTQATSFGFTLVQDGGTYTAPVPEMKKMVDSGEASFIWMYSNGHGAGEMGSKAMYCAHDLGAFWGVHDKLMSKEGYDILNTVVKNDKAKSGELSAFLASVVDQGKLKECLDSGKYDSRLLEESQLVQSTFGANFQGTPYFQVNDTSFAGASNWDDMKSSL